MLLISSGAATLYKFEYVRPTVVRNHEMQINKKYDNKPLKISLLNGLQDFQYFNVFHFTVLLHMDDAVLIVQKSILF